MTNGRYVVGYEGESGSRRLVGVLGPYAAYADAEHACLTMRRLQPERTFWTTTRREMTVAERRATRDLPECCTSFDARLGGSGICPVHGVKYLSEVT